LQEEEGVTIIMVVVHKRAVMLARSELQEPILQVVLTLLGVAEVQPLLEAVLGAVVLEMLQ
jgi:hypothetical protein